jgi:hypothetical protein
MDKYRIKVPGIFTSEIYVDGEDNIDAILKVKEILKNKADQLQWEYESISPEDYWRVLKA